MLHPSNIIWLVEMKPVNHYSEIVIPSLREVLEKKKEKRKEGRQPFLFQNC
jgi:hypothetical protein